MIARWIATLCLVCTAACTPTRDFHEVESPSYWWSVQRGLCGYTHVVDVEGVLWSEGGCETGPQELTRVRALEPNEHERLKRLFASLPAKGTPEQKTRCTETSHALRVRRNPDEDVVWLLCVERGALSKSEGVPDPYREVVQVFLEGPRE